MPLYKFECDGCGAQDLIEMTFAEHDERKAEVEWVEHGALGLLKFYADKGLVFSGCGGKLKQVYSFSYKRPMQEHYNHTTNTFVRNESEFESDIHRMGDAMSARMGFDTNYEVVDGHDKEGLGVTDDGLEATARRKVEEGRAEAKLYL